MFCFVFVFKALVLWRNKEDVIFCFPLTFGILSALKLVIHRCSAKLNCLQSSWEKQNGLQETSVLVLRVFLFFFFFSLILRGKCLLKLILKITPRANLLCTYIFLRGQF